MAESITRKNIDLDILDYYDGKIKAYVDGKVGTGGLTIDDTLSDTSTNPVQNKVIKQAIDDKADKTTATKDTDGLMSAEDKSKLDSADDTYALKSKYGDTTINVGRKAGSVIGWRSTAEGSSTIASGSISHAEGFSTTASGSQTHAEGTNVMANGQNSHAEGYSSNIASDLIANLSSSTPIDDIISAWNGTGNSGKFNLSNGYNSHTEGNDCLALASNSHAEGNCAIARGMDSHAEGNSTIASGSVSHAEGFYTSASGQSSHAEGENTTASGNYSHAGGKSTIASGYQAFAHGCGTQATNSSETAFGNYNKSSSDTVFSIGDGTSDTNRHNAFEITKTGGMLHDEAIMTQNKISNPNLLINPDFKINQRGVSNFVTLGGTGSFVYTVDRWAIDDGGQVTVNSDGTLTVKGTISQILENAVGDNVTVSLGVVSGTATASYDNAKKTFSITAENAVISWAKLEYGSIATPFVAPDPALEKEKCQRYYYRITNQSSTNPQVLALAQSMDSAEMNFTINLPTAMRIPPTVTLVNKSWLSYSKGMLSSTTAVTGFARNGCMKPYNAVTVKCSGTFTSGSGYVIFIEPNGCIEFDAEM